MHVLSAQRYLSPEERSRSRLVAVRRWVWAGLALSVLLVLDRPLYALVSGVPSLGGDLHRFVRQLGSLWIWLAVFGLLVLHDRRALQARGLGAWRPSRHGQGPAALHRGGLVLLSAVGGGAAAELLKVVLRLSRPVREQILAVDGSVLVQRGERLWLWLSDERVVAAGDIGVGMASSHAGVAFGGLAMVARLWPGTWPLALGLAALCGASRVMDGAHFVSDVAVGGALGCLCAWALVRATEPGHARGSVVLGDDRLG